MHRNTRCRADRHKLSRHDCRRPAGVRRQMAVAVAVRHCHSESFDDTAWIARRYDIGRDVACDNTARPDD